MGLAALLPALALAAVGSAAAVLPRDAGHSQNFYSLQVEQVHRVQPLRKRDTSVTLYNITDTSYLVQLSIGTPGQLVKVAIDTGSDELWVNPDCQDTSLQASQAQECLADGLYDPTKSSTSSQSGLSAKTTSIKYGIGDVKLSYVKDTISLPGGTKAASVTNAQFGMATSTEDLNEGILGLSYGLNTNLNYSNFIDELESQGVTNSKAFSVALGSDKASDGGVIIFGGVDTKKFTGKLSTHAILGPQFTGDINRYYLPLASVGVDRGSGNTKTYSTGTVAVVLDSGSSLSYLPDAVAKAMARDFGATFSQRSGVYIVPCSQQKTAGNFQFAFGTAGNTATFSVPIDDFIVDLGGDTCILGATTNGGTATDPVLLGDSFMRSVYVVFDQTTDTVSIAPYANCGQNEQAIPKTGAANFTGECDPGATSGSSSGSTTKPNAAANWRQSASRAAAAAAAMLAVAVAAAL
ncbi:aspartic peptidase domain-containing protein [Lasiosphaeria miniovina]|uniref:Aspartic peptidase domain-containing protein n=1 Tax=Lasiosphaeria miniovina TaxID=1954250 RepID=A0AA39ZTL0_9PEZI|nr:aspartic peptidase domain-containing protein [Lasiosphaeria miniovina]KAK0703469.1 aspartic peptidase domain-containing protein [Lasiosphaeria miniovina]